MRQTKCNRLCSLLVGLGVVGLILNGCAREVVKQEGKREKESLTMWSYYEVEAQVAGLDELVQGFNESQEYYELRWEYVPMSAFDKRLSRAYTEQGLPDLVVIDNPDMLRFIQLGVFEEITEAVEEWGIEEEYYPVAMETVCFEEKYYGLPFGCNTVGLIYNSKLLEERKVNPPRDWKELEEAAKQLTTDTVNGFMMCGMNGEQGTFQILPWMLAAGESKNILEESAVKDTFSFFESLMREGSLSLNCINLSQVDLARQFVEGKIAMMENGPWVLPILEEAGIDYKIAPLPEKDQKIAVLGGENLGIIKGKNVEGGFAFMEYCMEGEELLQFLETAYMLPAKIQHAKEMVENQPNMQVFEQQLHYAVARTSIMGWPRISAEISNSFYKMVSGEYTPENAANQVVKIYE